MGATLAGCVSAPPPPPPPPPPIVEAPPPPAFVPPPRSDQPNYFRLRSTPVDDTPVRIALLLPFTNPSPETRALANALQRAAELALFDSGNSDIILMPRDDGGSPELAVQATRQAINDGAEIILGPLFAQLAVAVGPVARAQGVPVISFSSDRDVGGNGVFLLSFQPESEVARIISYAARS
ncbi:MAG: ABC transporter substrate-binding protein, partial [Micropepsaceae bacterium]